MDYLFIILNYINNYIEHNYILSVICYFIFLTIFFSFSLPGGLIVILASGFFFDFILGFVINLFSITLGSLFFVFLSKSIFSKLIKKTYYKYSYKITSIIKNSSYEYLILLRLIIGTPLLIQNLCISLINISKFKLIISTLIGFTPIMLLFSYLGSYLSDLVELQNVSIYNLLPREFIFIVIILILGICIRIYYKKN